MLGWRVYNWLWKYIYLHDKTTFGSSLPFSYCCVFCCVVLSFAMIINLLMWADARNTRGQQEGDGYAAWLLDWLLPLGFSVRAKAHVLLSLGFCLRHYYSTLYLASWCASFIRPLSNWDICRSDIILYFSCFLCYIVWHILYLALLNKWDVTNIITFT